MILDDCVPDAVQREAKRNGAPLIRDRNGFRGWDISPNAQCCTVPVLQRNTSLRFVLRCARDTR
jgi:hypothetical protein